MNYGRLIYYEMKTFEKFRKCCFCLGGAVCLYCWCTLCYKLLFLMRVLDSVSFSVYMNILKTNIYYLKMSRSVNNVRTKGWYSTLTNVYILICSLGNLLVLSAVKITGLSSGNITGTVGSNYCWYFRQEILLVMSAVIINIVFFGRRYYNVYKFIIYKYTK